MTDACHAWGMDPVLTGARIRSYRLGLSLSQDGLLDVLAELGIVLSKNSLSCWERGKKKPTIDHLCALCCVFDCSLDDLVSYHRGDPRTPDETGSGRPLPYIPKTCLVHVFVF